MRLAPQPQGDAPAFADAVPRSERAVYAALAAISVGAASAAADFDDSAEAVVFCGGNAVDRDNLARAGLRAAGELGIVSPLDGLSPDIVSQLAEVGHSAFDLLCCLAELKIPEMRRSLGLYLFGSLASCDTLACSAGALDSAVVSLASQCLVATYVAV